MKELEKNQKVKISSYIYQEVFCKKKMSSDKIRKTTVWRVLL